MRKDERIKYDKLARLGCILCRYLNLGETPAEIHHIRRIGQPRDSAEVIPLCPTHHRGNIGVHGLGRKGFYKRYGVTEEDLFKNLSDLIQTHHK